MGDPSYFLYSIGNATVDLKKLKKETLKELGGIDIEEMEEGAFIQYSFNEVNRGCGMLSSS